MVKTIADKSNNRPTPDVVRINFNPSLQNASFTNEDTLFSALLEKLDLAHSVFKNEVKISAYAVKSKSSSNSSDDVKVIYVLIEGDTETGSQKKVLSFNYPSLEANKTNNNEALSAVLASIDPPNTAPVTTDTKQKGGIRYVESKINTLADKIMGFFSGSKSSGDAKSNYDIMPIIKPRKHIIAP